MKKTWKILSLLLALTLCVGLFAGCSSNDDAASQEPQSQTEEGGDGAETDAGEPDDAPVEPAGDESERTVLAVGFDASFPPYGYIENGEYVGFDIDLAREVCRRQGWELDLHPIDWASKDMELSSGAIDCIWNGFTINGREDQYTWSVPYVDNSQVMVVAADSGISTFADLAGKTVMVQDDSSAYHALADEDDEDMAALTASFGELILVPEYNTAFMNLEAGAADAVAMDIGVAEYQISSRGDGFVMLSDILVKEEYGVGFYLGNTDLRDVVQETLYEMYDDGTLMQIAEEWGLQDSVVLAR